jgi:hypothetical protein
MPILTLSIWLCDCQEYTFTINATHMFVKTGNEPFPEISLTYRQILKSEQRLISCRKSIILMNGTNIKVIIRKLHPLALIE